MGIAVSLAALARRVLSDGSLPASAVADAGAGTANREAGGGGSRTTGGTGGNGGSGIVIIRYAI